jgi:hypothetical protein
MAAIYVHFWARLLYAASLRDITVDSIIDYTDNGATIGATHAGGVLVGTVAAGIVGLLVLLIGWMLDIPSTNDSLRNTINTDDDLLHCTDRMCRCIYHREERFDFAKNEWISQDCKNPDCKCNYHAYEEFNADATAWQ